MKNKPPDMNDPRVIATVGGLVDEAGITVAIYGEHLEPSEITELLGVEATHSHRRGDRKGPRSPPYTQGAWLLSARCETPVTPDAVLSRLLTVLPDKDELWNRLALTYELHLRLGVHFTGWNKGFELSSATVQRLARMRLQIGFDLYAYGDEEE